MNPYFVAWNTKGTSDKIWGYIYENANDCSDPNLNSGVSVPNKYEWMSFRPVYIFWGARGKAMQFKKSEDNFALRTLRTSKINKGYVPQSSETMEKIWPGFDTELGMLINFAVLTGRKKK